MVKIDNNKCLLCPDCDNPYLHQESVEMFWRDREDSERGTYVQSSWGNPPIVDKNSEMNQNPSGRRDGLRIKFSCENCGREDISLTLSQHKGWTLMEWEK